MFTICADITFAARHQLTLPDGSVEPIHGHNWVVAVAVSSAELDESGVVFDFNRLKKMPKGVVAGFDGADLEQFECFEHINSSAENVAKYVYECLEGQLPRSVMLEYVKVTEQQGCWGRYSRR